MKNCPQCSAAYPDEYVVCPKDGSRLSSGSPWEVNSVVRGKYKILGKIGQGGMASVYRAHHELLDEPRALKVINPELARDEIFVKRFKKEAINTRKLQHSNAVRVDDLDIAEDGRPFIAMELVGGESLKDLIERSGPLPIASAVQVASQVCEALQAAHDLGMTHRDIKPDNIVLLRGRDLKLTVKILDFGIASLKEATGGGSNTLTGTGVVIGTPDYMSPEQAMGKRGEEIDGRSDIYSLGIVVYRMLTGELPFKANTTVEMILHHVQDIPIAPQKLKPQLGIPDSIADIVMKALEKDREKRFQTARGLGEALRLALSSIQRPVPLPGVSAAVLATVKTAPAGAPVAPKPPTAAPRPVAPPPTPAAKPPVPAPRPAPRPVSPMRPAAPIAKPEKKSPVVPIAAALVVVAILALSARLLFRRPAPTVSTSPAESVSQPSAQPTSQPVSKRAPKKAAAVTSEPATSGPAAGLADQTGSKPAPPATTEETGKSATPVAPPTGQPAAGSTTVPAKDVGQEQRETKPSAEPQGTTTAATQPRSRPGRQLTPAERAAEIMRQDMRGDVKPMNDRATELFNNGKYWRAAEVFRRVLGIEPNNERALKGLKKCQQKIKEMGGAYSDQ